MENKEVPVYNVLVPILAQALSLEDVLMPIPGIATFRSHLSHWDT